MANPARIDRLTSVTGNTQPAGHHRIDWVDYAKGFCIVFVVMMHATLGVEKAAGSEGWMHHLVSFAAPFRMPDFFLISGLFLGLVIDRPWRRYIDRKVVHFIYFYALWLTIQFAFKAPGWMGEGLSAADVATKFALAFVEPFGTLWFIYALPVFFMVTRLVKAVPPAIIFAIAAILEIAPVHTGWLLIDEFASRYVYFFAGYWLAPQLFRLVDWALANKALSLAFLAFWALVNGAAVFSGVPQFVSAPLAGAGIDVPASLSQLPGVSLGLGALGAAAVVLISALLSEARWTAFLRYLGEHSIVVYLAFFLPMAISRVVLLKFAPFLDVGTVSLVVTMAAVAGPIVLYWLTRLTGIGGFLFHRPAWAGVDKKPSRDSRAQLHPAE